LGPLGGKDGGGAPNKLFTGGIFEGGGIWLGGAEPKELFE